MIDLRRGWQPDPFGLHEWRFFSDDGAATLLVRDGGVNSYDEPPADHRYDHSLADPAVFPEGPYEPSQGAPAIGPHVVAQTAEPRSATPEMIRALRAANPDERMRPPTVVKPADPAKAPGPMLSRSARVVYAVVLVAMAASGVALLVIHLGGHGHAPAQAATTTTTKPVTSTTSAPTTTVAIPSALQPSAAVAAQRFIGSWEAGNEAEAATVGTAPAVATLFATHYTPGLAISRGCSDAFSITCTYGPPGGADPTDPVYQLHVAQAASGWYVSSVTIDN